MKIQPFKVEEWMNAYEDDAVYNIAETCVDSVSLDTLFQLTGTDKNVFWNQLSARRLTYGAIVGAPDYKKGICGRYQTIGAEDILSTHGAAGANHLVLYSLVEPGDKVISVIPTYQQLYSIPESYGAEVSLLRLKKENGYLPDLDELRRLAVAGTKIICINNPNNPTGTLMGNDMLKEICAIAKGVGAWVLSDETYRGLNQDGSYTESVADLYEKGISVSSMSKVFSLAGLRLGWIATKDRAVIEACMSHRDYSIISCGMLDEAIAALALEHADLLLERNIALVQKNLSILDKWVASQPHISYIKPQAGTISLLHYDFPIPSEAFCKALFQYNGTLLTPGSAFEEEHCMRIGYACDTAQLEQGLEQLGLFIAAVANGEITVQ